MPLCVHRPWSPRASASPLLVSVRRGLGGMGGKEGWRKTRQRLCRVGSRVHLAFTALPAEDPGASPTGNHMVSSKTS